MNTIKKNNFFQLICNADENECMANGGIGKCEQICMNTEGSFVCSCSPGYTINEDRLSCQGTNCSCYEQQYEEHSTTF